MHFPSSFNVFFLLPLTIFAAPLVVTTTTSTTIPGATYNLTLVGKTGGAVVSSNPNDGEIVFPQVSLREQSPDSVVYDITNGWKTKKEDKEVPATALFLSPSDYEKRVADSASVQLLAYGQDQKDETCWFIYPAADPKSQETGRREEGTT